MHIQLLIKGSFLTFFFVLELAVAAAGDDCDKNKDNHEDRLDLEDFPELRVLHPRKKMNELGGDEYNGQKKICHFVPVQKKIAHMHLLYERYVENAINVSSY